MNEEEKDDAIGQALKKLKIWDRLDEVIGATLLTSTALVAMLIGYDSSIAQMSITGVVALLAVKAVKPGKEENG